MRNKLLLLPIVIVLAAAMLPFLRSQEAPKATVNPPDPGTIQKLIKDLEAPDYPTRERASRELVRLEEYALEPVKRAVAGAQSLELAARGRRILNQLAIHEPGGEVVAGLKLRLTASQETIKHGQVVWLTSHLANMTHQDLNVQVGYTTCGNYFECGSTLRRILHDGKEEQPAWKVGFCGTGAGPVFQTLPPRSVVAFQTQVALLMQQQDNSLCFSLGSGGYTSFGVAKAATRPTAVVRGNVIRLPANLGTHTFQMLLAVTPEMTKDRGFALEGKYAGVRPANETARFWSGTVKSNNVCITVLP
jgi:hypothetical protein